MCLRAAQANGMAVYQARVLATWVIHRFFGILGGNFRHAIPLFRPAWARLFFEYTPRSLGDHF